jgi:hypothetical protein
MTNAATGNQILVFLRDRKGRLEPVPGATASTGGAGGDAASGEIRASRSICRRVR